ncbi:Uma2 family endonuclease [Pseudonocardia sp.]|uniref:Uma2 family endonuclease n=1 Tax=Pseudonocardia sp. TaxID=60912 RepID=UPI00260200E7|nr:Uma2 family endonuclease [Pseudonocardia sp.]
MTALPEYARPLTSAEYAALPEDIDARFELQEGNRVMSPSPVPRHQLGHFRLAAQLDAQLPGHVVLQEVDIDLELVPPDQPGTVRVPDVVVVPREAFQRVDEHGGLLRASDVSLAVEILSRGSVRTDSRIKHEEYADAGIGHYWMIDLLDGPSLVACHLAGAFGYRDDEPVRGTVVTRAPFPLRIDLDALLA